MAMLGAFSAISAAPNAFVQAEEGCFRDPLGRQLLLHGANLGAKHRPYLPWAREEDFGRFKEWGFNCLRLYTVWAAVEPHSGQFDEGYLKQLDERIAWARKHGLYVILDMHQDLWGEKIPGGDGAPAWATLDDGMPHETAGDVWSAAYYLSPMVQTAFDNFWANKPLADGAGIQDHFAAAWKHLARRYADETAVIGYDIINEPSMGSDILTVLPDALPELARIMGGEAGFDPIALFNSNDGMAKLTRKLDDVEAYRALMDAAETAVNTFEREKLAPMYRRVAAAIREVDPNHVLFFEPTELANIGVRSALPGILDAAEKPFAQQALAPHAYDIVLDTASMAATNEGRLELILKRHREHAEQLGLPLVIGEWGAFYGAAEAAPVARMYLRQLENVLAGETHWEATANIAEWAYLPSIARPRPAAVSGKLLNYKTDPASGVFECTWKEDSALAQPSLFHLPAAWYPHGALLNLSPAGTDTWSPVNAGELSVPAAQGNPERHLTVKPAEAPGR